jgi:hypothetical protein
LAELSAERERDQRSVALALERAPPKALFPAAGPFAAHTNEG